MDLCTVRGKLGCIKDGKLFKFQVAQEGEVFDLDHVLWEHTSRQGEPVYLKIHDLVEGKVFESLGELTVDYKENCERYMIGVNNLSKFLNDSVGNEVVMLFGYFDQEFFS